MLFASRLSIPGLPICQKKRRRALSLKTLAHVSKCSIKTGKVLDVVMPARLRAQSGVS